VYVSNDRTLYAVNAASGTGSKLFETSVTASRVNLSSPLVVDGTLFINDNRRVIALDATTGDQQWTYTPPETPESETRYISSAAVVDGTVYIAITVYGLNPSPRDGFVIAIDAETGTEEWRYTEPSTDSFSNSLPHVVDGTVYVQYPGTLHAIAADSGEQEWTADLSRLSMPTVADGVLYYSADGVLQAIDATTGEDVWRFTDISPNGFTQPVVVAGIVYGVGDGTIYALDAATGDEVWRFADVSGSGHTVTLYEDTVFACTSNINTSNTLYALDRSTGAQQWVFDGLPPFLAGALMMPTAADGTIYITDDTTLYALDTTTGEEQWRWNRNNVDSLSEWPPTYVSDPENGSSDGSRVSLGTFGQHDSWTGEPVCPSAETGPPAVRGERKPRDHDGDGLYEDVNGDCEVDIFDVQTFSTTRDEQVIQNNTGTYDFTNDDQVTAADVQRLFDLL
jgi:outer membrane protein assembly factor BamB